MDALSESVSLVFACAETNLATVTHGASITQSSTAAIHGTPTTRGTAPTGCSASTSRSAFWTGGETSGVDRALLQPRQQITRCFDFLRREVKQRWRRGGRAARCNAEARVCSTHVSTQEMRLVVKSSDSVERTHRGNSNRVALVLVRTAQLVEERMRAGLQRLEPRVRSVAQHF